MLSTHAAEDALMIKVGTSGFSFDDWRGIVYPPSLKKEAWLPFYEQELGLRALEINYTYYRMPAARTLEALSRKTSADFEFSVKAHQSMTHDIIARATGRLLDTSAAFKSFKDGLAPLMRDNKLACVLMQFPYAFRPTAAHLDYLSKARDLLSDAELVVEFRNRAWQQEATFMFLRDHCIGYCAVDEPRLPGLVPFAAEVTARVGYVRFHGRSTQWFRAPVAVRYDYLYQDAELQEFIAPAHSMASQARRLMVFFNNCHMGQAARNALSFTRLLADGTHVA